MIREVTFRRALEVVHRSGVHKEVEALMRPPHAGGRPRALGVDVFFAAAMLSVGRRKSGTLTSIHELLTTSLQAPLQVSLGIRKPGTPGACITIRQVRYMLEAIERKLAHTEGRAPKLDPADRAERVEALQSIMNRLLEATMPVHLPSSGAYAVDATAIDSYARGHRTRPKAAEGPNDNDQTGVSDADIAALTDDDDGPSWDPDAHWGYGTRTFDNKRNHFFGYQAVAFARINYPGPKLVERITLAPANSQGVEEAITLLDSLVNDGTVRPGLLLCDRGFSDAVPSRWKNKLRDRNVEQIMDIHPSMHGARDFEGITMLDGTPHCPATPERLHEIIRPANLSAGKLGEKAKPRKRIKHQQRVAALKEFKDTIAERQTYAFRRVAGPDHTGKERWECPAQAGKRVCDNCPLSQFLPADTPRVENPPPAETAPKACSQRTITIGGDVTAKIRQRLYWGSEEWIKEYSARSAIEAAYGNLKNPSTESVRRGWIRVVGNVKTSLMLTLAQAASNLRQLRKWARRTGDYTDPLTTPNPPNLGFIEIQPPDTINTQATVPPDTPT